MKSPENGPPSWVDPSGSKIPAYLRKAKAEAKEAEAKTVAQRNFLVEQPSSSTVDASSASDITKNELALAIGKAIYSRL